MQELKTIIFNIVIDITILTFLIKHNVFLGFSKALGSSKLYERTGVKIIGYCPGLTNTRMLEEVALKCINVNFAIEFEAEIANCRKQSSDHVAQGLVNIMDEAKPGSLWVVENGNDPYEIELKAGVKKKAHLIEEKVVM